MLKVIYLITEQEIKKQIQNVILKRRDLYVKQDNHEISDVEYEIQMKTINDEYKRLIAEEILLLDKKIECRNEEIQEKQKEIIKKVKILNKPVIKKVFVPIKDLNNKSSYISLILKFLSVKKVDSEDKLVAVIKELKKDVQDYNLRMQIRNTISIIKNKTNNQFNGYSFNEQTYMVNEQCQEKLF